MIDWTPAVALWLADLYLLSSVLLVGVLGLLSITHQPVRRLAITKSALVATLLLAGLCCLPGWSLLHLTTEGTTDATGDISVVRSTVVEPAAPLPRDLRNDFFDANMPNHAASPPSADSTQASVVQWPAISWPTAVVVGYLLGVVGVLAWLALGALAARRLLAQAQPAPAELGSLLAEFVDDSGRPELLMSLRIDVAVALGIRRPVVVLPRAWVEREPAERLAASSVEQMRSVLAHEWAHVRHGDLRWLALGRVLLVLLWAQPLYWLLRRSMRLDQESLADAAAAELTSRQRYAEQLVAWARHVPARRRIVLPAAVGLWESPSQLRRRIALLLDERLQLLRDCPRRWRVSVGVALAAVACGLSLLTLQPASRAADEAEITANSVGGKESLQYTGTVVDKRSGQPIEGAKVVVRRMTSSTNPWKTLAETEHITDSDGKYEFTIPPAQFADPHLYIELDVTHADYAPQTEFGYALSIIRKNEELGGRPFFERVELEPADEITGLVQAPNGQPVAAMPVLAFSKADPKDLSEYGSFVRGQTDADGRFRLNVAKGGHAVLWLLPDEYSQQTHVLDDRAGDLGKFTLEEGIRLSGRVVDRDGQPLAGIWVNADLVDGPAKQEIRMPVSDYIKRSALTDAEGTFELAPLPPGTYRVFPRERPMENPRRDRQPRPLPAVFLPQRVTLTAVQRPEPLLIQAAETVTLEAQIYDSAGKPRRGHEVHFIGRDGDERGDYYFAQGEPDDNGHIILQVPKGLSDAKLDLSCNEHQVLRYRRRAKWNLQAQREIEFGTLNGDQREIEIYYYTSPILIVAASDRDGKLITGFKPALFYRRGIKPREIGSHWISGVVGEVNFEHQEDGRWRSEQLLPDEEFILTVLADGYQPASRTMKLAEGEVKELDFTLTENGDAAENTSGSTDHEASPAVLSRSHESD